MRVPVAAAARGRVAAAVEAWLVAPGVTAAPRTSDVGTPEGAAGVTGGGGGNVVKVVTGTGVDVGAVVVHAAGVAVAAGDGSSRWTRRRRGRKRPRSARRLQVLPWRRVRSPPERRRGDEAPLPQTQASESPLRIVRAAGAARRVPPRAVLCPKVRPVRARTALAPAEAVAGIVASLAIDLADRRAEPAGARRHERTALSGAAARSR